MEGKVMMILNSNQKMFSLIFFCLSLLVSCQLSSSQTGRSISSSLPTLLPTSTESTIIRKDIKYELTYFSDCGTDIQCMYAIEIGCLETENPCIGETQLLFKIEKDGEGPNYFVSSGSWSPDGQQVVVSATGNNGRGDIFIGDWAGKKWTNLTNSPNNEWEPVWSPDGQSIIYIAKPDDSSGSFKIISISPDGKNKSQLFQEAASSFTNILYPFWSSDNKQITFTQSDENGYDQIFIANLDGTDIKQITNQLEDHIDPHYSQDGQWIVFRKELQKNNNTSNLYMIRPDGTGEKAITRGNNFWKGEQTWSPTENWIAYVEIADDNFDIYLIRPDGEKLIKVTKNNIEKISLAWRSSLP